MFKVLIAEDENIIRKGLIYSFDWGKYKCDIVGEASNGIEALDKVLKLKPDIIIVDINMPTLNGLDLLRRLNREKIQSIILSGYDNFNYAQEAIKLDSVAYLLKPINYTELGQALDKAIRNIIKNSKIYKEEDDFLKVMDKLDLGITINKNRYSSLTTSIIKYVEDNYYKNIHIEDLIDHTLKSKTTINTKFKEETGKTINYFINTTRIRMAIKIMSQEDDTIDNISRRVGYSNYRYFIRVFKQYVNLTPTEFIDRFF